VHNVAKGRFRRCDSLVLYWQEGQPVFENFALGTKISADPITVSILHFCGEWRTRRDITSYLKTYSPSSVAATLRQLCKHGLLECSNYKLPREIQHAMMQWSAWNPAAGFFHFSTKDTQFAADPARASEQLKQRAKLHPMPLPLKTYPKARKAKLPNVQSSGEFPQLLKARRTWRMYGNKPVPLETLADILQLTFGIQRWANVPGLGRAAMKTSPSCGCLHPTEAYVLAQRVEGLNRGIYHYNANHHELEWLRGGVARKALEKNLGNQWWFAKAAFLVLMTAVFARTRWKYDHPRVYRGILIEAGHLCQTFWLTATWLGLAPFSTIAYTDTQWEKWLGLDGVTESVLYIAGAGTRPKNLQQAHLGIIASS
jgi:SagB-type dehydrogenase family enzyme